MGYWRYPRYVSVAEKKAKAAGNLAKLRKKNPQLQPIVIEGTAIAKTWWGKSWNLNLERYADYSNRIGRGRSYVRHGAVLDLQIRPGQVQALVQGTRSKPYTVIIQIKEIAKNIWQKMKAACAGKLGSLPELLEGKFPESLGEIFTAQGQGLFPSPQEIEFNCSCPDWAYMCKHVAAALYGIGSRLDVNPGLFFELRKVHMDDLIQQAVKDRSRWLLKKAEKTNARMIAEPDLAGLFGIDMEEPVDLDFAAPAEKANRKPTQPKRSAAAKKTLRQKEQTNKKPRRTAPKKTGFKKAGKPAAAILPLKIPAPKSPAKNKIPGDTLTSRILAVIRQSKKGVDVAALKQKTGCDEKQIRNVLYRAYKEKLIRRAGRGVYQFNG